MVIAVFFWEGFGVCGECIKKERVWIGVGEKFLGVGKILFFESGVIYRCVSV